MKLMKLELTNFQGMKAARFDFGGRSANVFGTNGTGKTTIFNAITWLLFGKASDGEKGYSPKTKDKDGEDVHHLEHAVKASFMLESGEIVSLSKTLKEVWKKPHGTPTEKLGGHTTAYTIDGVPASEREFETYLKGIADPEKAKALTMVGYFCEEMPWEDRRRMLLDICGDISEDDVMASDPKLEPLSVRLAKPGEGDGRYTVEEYMKIAKRQRADLGKELEQLPERIDEAAKAVPDLTGISISEVEEAIKGTEAKKSDLERQMAAATEDDSMRELREGLSKLRVELNAAEAEHIKAANEAAEGATATHRELKRLLSDLQDGHSALEKAAKLAKADLDDMKSRRERLAAEHAAESAKQWDGETDCYACKRPLPEDRVEAARASWNGAKAIKMENIRKQIEASCSKPAIAGLEASLARAEAAVADNGGMMAEAERKEKEAKAAIPSAPPFEGTPEHALLAARIANIERAILTGGNAATEAQKAIQAKIDVLSAELRAHAETMAKAEMAKAQQRRVEELEERMESIAEMHESAQMGVWLCERFIIAKTSLLTDSINRKFKNVSFNLFDENITNEGIAEKCEVMVPAKEGLVPYGLVNHSAKINAGVEVINVLSEHWGLSMPLFIDNRESIVRLADTDAQVISLTVSAAHPELEIALEPETGSKRTAA